MCQFLVKKICLDFYIVNCNFVKVCKGFKGLEIVIFFPDIQMQLWLISDVD